MPRPAGRSIRAAGDAARGGHRLVHRMGWLFVKGQIGAQQAAVLTRDLHFRVLEDQAGLGAGTFSGLSCRFDQEM